MDAKDRIIRARIQIQRNNTFFAYLSLYLKFHEVEKEKVPPLFYIRKNIKKLTNKIPKTNRFLVSQSFVPTIITEPTVASQVRG